MFALHPSLQRALVAYGAGAIIAGVATLAMSLDDAWSLLGSGGGSFIPAGVLRLVLGLGTLAVVLGAALFMLSMARWQADLMPSTVLATAAGSGVVNLAVAWRAVPGFQAPNSSGVRKPPLDRSPY